MSSFWERLKNTVMFYFSWTSLKNFYEYGVPGMGKWTGRRSGERARKRRENRP